MNRFSMHVNSLLFKSLVALFCLSFLTASFAEAASKTKRTKRKRPITKLQFDPTAEKVELFAGMKSGQLETLVIAKNEKQGKILIENKTDKPLTIIVPDSFVAVPVHYQIGGLGGGGGGLGGGQGGQGGQQQPSGGGLSGLGGGGGGGLGGGGGMGGGGFFSIPPEKVVSVNYKAVCLAHGLKEPTPRTKMRLVPTTEFSQDPALKELLVIVASGKANQQAAQAAAWHIVDKMSWQELAHKSVKHLGGGRPTPYFSRVQLLGAQNIVALSVGRAREKAEAEGKKPTTPRTTRSRVSQ